MHSLNHTKGFAPTGQAEIDDYPVIVTSATGMVIDHAVTRDNNTLNSNRLSARLPRFQSWTPRPVSVSQSAVLKTNAE